MKQYYDRRALEYDATSWELTEAEAAGSRDLAALERLLRELPPARLLDIGCGTGWLTSRLAGTIVGVDQSEAMLQLARRRVPDALFVRADIPPLPFPDDTFDRALASHVYGHIDAPEDRALFVAEALRVARTLILVEQAWRPPSPRESLERRTLRDGSEHLVFKRYFEAAELAAEVAGEVLLATDTFVAVATTQPREMERP